MKIARWISLFSFLLLSCDEPENEKKLTDYQGISLALRWKGVEPIDRSGIGIAMYDHKGLLLYQNFDSLFFSISNLPDGQFKIDVDIFSPLDHREYFIDIQGLDTGISYSFESSFGSTDAVGFSKPSLLMTKNKFTYTFKEL